MSGVEESQHECKLSPEQDKSLPRGRGGGGGVMLYECCLEGLTFEKKGTLKSER